MFDAAFRTVFGARLAPLARALVRAGVAPTTLTVAGFGLALGAAGLVAAGARWAGLAAWLASRVCDGLDGLVARTGGRTSAFGAYLDVTLDMAAYSLLLVAFASRHPSGGLVWPLILVGYVLASTSTLALSSLLEARAQRTGDRSVQFTPGLAEAGETTVVYVLFTLWPGRFFPVAWAWCALVLATVVQRTLLARRLLRD